MPRVPKHKPEHCIRCALEQRIPLRCMRCGLEIAHCEWMICLQQFDGDELHPGYCFHEHCEHKLLRCAACGRPFDEDEKRICTDPQRGVLRCVHLDCDRSALAA